VQEVSLILAMRSWRATQIVQCNIHIAREFSALPR